MDCRLGQLKQPGPETHGDPLRPAEGSILRWLTADSPLHEGIVRVAKTSIFSEAAVMFKMFKLMLLLVALLIGGGAFMLFKTTAPFGLRYKEVPTVADTGVVDKAFKILTGSAPKLYEKRFGFLPGPNYLKVEVGKDDVIISKEPISDDAAELLKKGSEILGGDEKDQ